MDEKIKFGIITLAVILFQSSLKLFGVIITGSLSFLSETVDTFLDIVFISLTLYFIKQSQKPPDYKHMYGHAKIDSIGTLIQGIILINLYVYLIINAIQVMIHGTFYIVYPEIGLGLLIISFSVNIIFSRILIRKGKHSKSLVLEIQGLNLFQDSIRALFVILSFVLALFGIMFTDAIFSIVLSIWIIIGAYKLIKNGITELLDTNPINSLLLEKIRQNIFNLEHVNGVREIKARASGDKLFLEVSLSVEDHISIARAQEITKSIQTMSTINIPFYNVECIIEMNPLKGEESIGESIMNLIYSIKVEFPKIININGLNIFKFKDKYFVSLGVLIDDSLSLEEAHDVCSHFENDLKKQAPYFYRIITHIEGHPKSKIFSANNIECTNIEPKMMQKMKQEVEKILRTHPKVRGYHGFEFWAASNYYIIELHVFFEGSLNIAIVHNYTTELEQKIRKKLKIENLEAILLHAEPIKGRIDGIFF